MSKEIRERLEFLVKERKSLLECARKREISKEIEELKSKLAKNNQFEPFILVKYAGKSIGRLEFDSKESSYIFKSNDGSSTEVGFKYEDVRGWASMNGFQLKIETV